MRKFVPNLMAMPLVACLAVSAAAWAESPSTLTADQDRAGQQQLADVRAQVFQMFPRDVAGPSRFGGQPEAFVGREQLYLEKQSASLPECRPLKDDPLKLIARRARQTNIVIINESHSSPRDRHFISSVLHILRRQGYSIYAAETFTRFESIVHPEVLGFDGWYSNEPTFAQTIRTAKRLGYSLVAYEETQAQRQAGPSENLNSDQASARREQSESDNLMSGIFTSHPNAKVIIHVGPGHVRERTQAGDQQFVAMAQRLKMAAGKDPLTISQTSCRSLTGSDVIAESFPRPAGLTGEFPVDLYVGHPTPKFRDGRPEWRREIGQKDVAVPKEFLDRSERVIVEVRPSNAGLPTVPVDRLLLFPGERLPLLLSRGKYRVDGFVESGRLDLAPTSLSVR
jgi:hypothetical protein